MHNLVELLKQAESDSETIECNGCNYTGWIALGTKITFDHISFEIKIMNTHKGGDYYKELTQAEYDHFKEYGWKIGVFDLSLWNSQNKVEKAMVSLRTLPKTKKHDKAREELTRHLEILTERFNEIMKRKNRYVTNFLKTETR